MEIGEYTFDNYGSCFVFVQPKVFILLSPEEKQILDQIKGQW